MLSIREADGPAFQYKYEVIGLFTRRKRKKAALTISLTVMMLVAAACGSSTTDKENTILNHK
ncbi:hypothetical protein HUB94_28410 (plasmid) [Paenibacillus cellulosilyticus]|nr:hypothetical protein HUB94_28410 [Paenibacillus cellulosilyticus]